MSASSSNSDFDTGLWNKLQMQLDGVLLKGETMTSVDYINLYANVTAQLTRPPLRHSGGQARNANNTESQMMDHGRRMYFWLTDYIMQYVQRLRQQMSAMEGTELLKYYVEQWKNFVFVSKPVNGIFLNLYRQWIQMEMHNGSNYKPLSDTMVQLWYLQLFKPLSAHLTRNTINLIDMRRNGQTVEDNFIKNLFNAYYELRPEGMPEVNSIYREPLGVYLKSYEEPYIESAIRYLEEKTKHLLGKKDVCGYIKAISSLIEVEEQQGNELLLPASEAELRNMLNYSFIESSVDRIYSALPTIFDSGNRSDLKMIYRLLDRIRGLPRLVPMRKAFEDYIFRHIIDKSPVLTVADNGAGVSTDIEAPYTSEFIDRILATMEQIEQLLSECFDGNKSFVEGKDLAFRKAVNSTELRNRCNCVPMRLLVEYCNLTLRANNATARKAKALNTDSEMTIIAEMRRVLRLYKLSKNKDEFLNHYGLHLARRLLNEQVVSLELERTIVTIISTTQSMEITTKLKDMLTDIDTSHDMSRSFSLEIAEDKSVSVSDVYIKVLKEASWPSVMMAERGEWNRPPTQLAVICDRFTKAYNERHSAHDKSHSRRDTAKRRLRWMWEYSKCSIQFFFPHSTGRVARSGYTFVLNTYQLAILMLFTESSGLGSDYDSPTGPRFTLEQIRYSTGIDELYIKAELAIFYKARILIPLSVNGHTLVQLNDKYNSKRLRLDISAIKHVRRAEEEEKVAKITAKDRRWYLMIDISRNMKARKTMEFNELFLVVAKGRAGMFEVTRDEFKEVLEKVIDCDTVKRGEGDNHNTLYYLP
ncbi:ubiquitin ligase (cullin) of SCF [Coemansia interrupta]|uniref:Ubiquitin ligase (Cullin) of SCF n=1 Tax=Coemansia interrupta TaxID=1126814 RepID=A0A9W8LFF1_9FUNG|nr:ubiquitin ligase (cullin) of SCF [Coemansia interrupta]